MLLVLGTAPDEATPDQCILAGPWCLPGSGQGAVPVREDGSPWIMPPEPLADAARLDVAARQAGQLVVELTPHLAAWLDERHGTSHNAQYWDFALAPWLTRFCEVLVDRLYRAEGILQAFKDRELEVPLIPTASHFAFADTRDFIMAGTLGIQWNHWLLGRLLLRRWPATWRRLEGGIVKRPAEPRHREMPLRRLARWLVFGLPFPHIKGFSLAQSVKLSIVLLRNRTLGDDTLSLADLSVPGLLQKFPLPLFFSLNEALKLARELLPASFLTTADSSGGSGRRAIVRTRVVSVAACEDDAYCLRMAAAREKGCRMIFIQHGGEYGFVRTSTAYPMVEYRQHRFITWGWTKHGDMPGNFLPLSHPQLATVRGIHREVHPRLLLVGTEMALLPYTLKSMLRGRQFFSYREDKASFFAALDPDIRKNSLYRPYFDIPTSLPDAPWLLRRFPDVTRCIGPLEPYLFTSRLLVFDHAGTTLAQALAADSPFLLFWRLSPEHFTPEVLPLLDALRVVGILHDTPESAAKQAKLIWGDVSKWWKSTLQVRKEWARLHARTSEAPVLPQWVNALAVV